MKLGFMDGILRMRLLSISQLLLLAVWDLLAVGRKAHAPDLPVS